MDTTFNFSLALPEILLLVLASCVLIFDAFSKHKQRHSTFVLSLLTLAVVAASVAWQWSKGVSGVSFGGLFVADELAHFLKLLSCVAVAATLIYGREYAEQRDMMERGGELYTLTLMALLGQMIMISANSMLTAYLGVELMSFALYALVALRREHRQSIEAALKYFVLGALASGILLYGMSMIFGATGHLEFPRI
ncbi:MAG TPA: NADH:ubiquinone oxidoreductase subunit N, partial [Alcaligenes faecalis]|nr:NADH:ubiquinone oxidoreductase subunit N [Alcaligenes faecalis]